jgi:hypothetical protein
MVALVRLSSCHAGDRRRGASRIASRPARASSCCKRWRARRTPSARRARTRSWRSAWWISRPGSSGCGSRSRTWSSARDRTAASRVSLGHALQQTSPGRDVARRVVGRMPGEGEGGRRQRSHGVACRHARGRVLRANHGRPIARDAGQVRSGGCWECSAGHITWRPGSRAARFPGEPGGQRLHPDARPSGGGSATEPPRSHSERLCRGDRGRLVEGVARGSRRGLVPRPREGLPGRDGR